MTVAHRSFYSWFATIDDPFVRLYMETSPIDNISINSSGAESFSGYDPDRTAALERLAPTAIARFEAAQTAALERLVNAVDGVDPVPLLCGIIFDVRFESWGTYFEPSSVPIDFELEIVAGIVANHPVGERRPATPADWMKVRSAAKTVRRWTQAVSIAYHLSGDVSESSRTRLEMLDRWFGLRGNAYPTHAASIASALASDREESLRRRAGFTIADVTDVAAAVIQRWQRGVTPALNEAWAHSCAITGETPSNPYQASDRFRNEWLASALRVLPQVLGIPCDGLPHLLDESRREQEVAVFEQLGRRQGTAPAVDSVLFDPPQRTRPFLILPPPLDAPGPDMALLVNPIALTTDLHLTVEATLDRASPRWPPARARAVDKHAVDLLQGVLRGSTALTGVFIDGPGGREEVDGVLLYEDTAIVIEGKGAPLKVAARRGSVDRLVAQLRELLTGGNRQLDRDHAYLLRGQPARFYDKNGRCVLEVDGAGIRRCYRVLPTLDGLGDLGTRLPRLVDLGVLPEGSHPWIIGLSHLHVVVDVLNRPAQLLGYLEFRQRWARERRIIVLDELEMLVMYLHQVDLPSRMASLSDGQPLMHATGQYILDAWYDGQAGLGPVSRFPWIKTTTRIRRFVDDRQRMKPDGWLASATAAFQVPITVATALDNMESELARTAQRDGFFASIDGEVAIVVAAAGVNWTEVLTDEQAKIVEPANILLFLRQRGNRLQLEDVRVSDRYPR